MARWLTRDGLPAMIDSYHRANLWARRTDAGKPAVALANGALMEAEGIRLLLRTDAASIVWFDEACEERRIPAAGRDGSYAVFELPPLAPFRLAAAYVE
jgi:hypothetical protein